MLSQEKIDAITALLADTEAPSYIVVSVSSPGEIVVVCDALPHRAFAAVKKSMRKNHVDKVKLRIHQDPNKKARDAVLKRLRGQDPPAQWLAPVPRPHAPSD